MIGNLSKKLSTLFGVTVLIAGIVLLDFAEKQQSPILGWIGLAFFAGGLILVAWASSRGPFTRAERRERLALLFGFTPGVKKIRQTINILAWFVSIFAGLFVGVYALEKYRPVDERVLLLFPCLMVLSLVVFSQFDSFKTVGGWRLRGWTLAWVLVSWAVMAGLVLGGWLLWFNGAFDQTEEVRRVSWIDKGVLIGKNGGHYVEIRSWEDPTRHLRLTIPTLVYHGLVRDRPLQLTLGKGVFHIEWVRAISLTDS